MMISDDPRLYPSGDETPVLIEANVACVFFSNLRRKSTIIEYNCN